MTNWDFGFTSEDDIVLINDNLKQMRELIQPLLDNLMKNPDKDYIQWNGKKRIEQIKDFAKKLDAIYKI